MIFLLACLLSIPTIHVPPAVLEREASAAAADGKLRVTADTEVRLDGAKVAFKDVPADATIETLEVAPDKKTIVRILFRSKPK